MWAEAQMEAGTQAGQGRALPPSHSCPPSTVHQTRGASKYKGCLELLHKLLKNLKLERALGGIFILTIEGAGKAE